jgi:hypothetical protein
MTTIKSSGLHLASRQYLVAPRVHRPWDVAARGTILMDIEVLDAFGRRPWLRSARGWRARASDSASIKRQGTEGFENSFASYCFACSLQHSSHGS